MGLVNWLFGKKDETAETVESTAGNVAVNDRGITFIPQLILSLDQFNGLVMSELDQQYTGTKRLCDTRNRTMKTELNKILETQTVSANFQEVRTIMHNWANIIARLRTIPDFHEKLGRPAADVRENLIMFEHILGVKPSILRQELE